MKNYLIQAYDPEDKGLLGTANQSLIIGARSMVRVNNRLKSFKPDRPYSSIRVSTYTNLYDENTHRVVKVIKAVDHHV